MKKLALLLLSISYFHISGQVLINEVQSSNSNTIADNTGDFDDWIEIHNPTTDTIDIGGLVLKDRIDTWAIPKDTLSTLLPPNGYFLLWADDDEAQGHFHTNFKLASGGEFLGLYESDSVTVIDSITLPELASNDSYNKCKNKWSSTNVPTPLAKNDCPVGIIKKLAVDETFSILVDSNKNLIIKTITNSTTVNELRLFTTNGTEVLTQNFINQEIINLSHLKSSTYFIKLSTPSTTYSKKIYLP